MAKKSQSQSVGRIAAFVNSYSNTGTGNGYKNAIESFLRCMNGLPKKSENGTKGNYDYELLFDQYLADKKRDHDEDFTKFANCLKAECASLLSARQRMTFARRILEDNGAKFKSKTVRDLKREMKGGAGTVDKVMTANVIESAMKELDLKGRALVFTLASSGARLNEILSLKLSDVDFESKPVKLTLRNTKNKQTRFTFITTEAAQCVKAWLEKREQYLVGASRRNAGLVRAGICGEKDTDSDLLFPLTDSAVNALWENALKAAGLYSQDEQTGRNQYRIHSFRKFFISQLSMAGQKTLAEHLAGHAGYLDGSYRRIDEEAAGKAYLAVQHVLTIGIPPEFREKASELNSTLKIQGESIEGLRVMNENLAAQMVKLENKNMEYEKKLSKIEEEQERLCAISDTFQKLFEKNSEAQDIFRRH
ncbi:tyrosine-type recombinase/integrase [Methanoregula sp.]|jgi:integrase|uniref:tyrosine-type recombinase/integrase n=1 Tax=Methanoregula sp. TaxID=2052170 RepID=UPI003C196D86